MIIREEQLTPYLKGNRDIIPLFAWNKMIKGKERGKSPIDQDWSHREYDSDKTLSKARKGHNVGFRLGPNDLVIDVDPRNFPKGRNPLKELCKFLGVDDLADTCPTVLTGGGGFHYYMNISADISLREVIEEFPGIEFKTIGRQVVAAGSKHPSGNFYEWDDLSPELKDTPEADMELLDILERPVVETDVDAGTLDEMQLSALLEELPVEEYNSHDEWFKIMCASHHATAGAGVEEFIHWSAGDSEYAEDESLIRYRWDTLSEKPVSITYKTLYQEVKDRGGSVAAVEMMSDFEDVDYGEDGEPELDLSDLYETPEFECSKNPGTAIALAEKLFKDCSNEDLVVAIRSALAADITEKRKAMTMIAARTGLSKSDINAIAKEVEDSVTEDFARVLARKTLDYSFKKGKHLLYHPNGSFWFYNGTHWEMVSKPWVEQQIMKVLDKIKIKTGLKVKENAIITEAASMMTRIRAIKDDVLRLQEAPYPVINCSNGEIWVYRDGKVKFRPHKYSSYQLQVLHVKFDPSEECPLYDHSIRETFRDFEDTEELVRHWEEIMGYLIQPVKNIASWFLLKGPGGDGKTTLMSILCALMGDAVLPESIETFKTDNHILARLVGKLMIYDDDLDKNMLLPGGLLKKVSEQKLLSANPKNLGAFNFVNVACPVMLSNGYPRTADVTPGFRRRANVIPFNRQFHMTKDSEIRDLSVNIIDEELGGVLNRALEGLRRLRDRGDFLVPKSAKKELDLWLQDANHVAMFSEECLTKTSGRPKGSVSYNDMYEAYLEWCSENGLRHKLGKQRMKNQLVDLDIEFGRVSGGAGSAFRNVLLKDMPTTDDFTELEEEEDWDPD